MTSSETTDGGCLCGKIRYTVPAKADAVIACHCRDCQKQSGSAFSVVAVYPNNAVKIEGNLSRFTRNGSSGNPVHLYFCGHCGSPIHSETEMIKDRGVFVLNIGTLDNISDLKPQSHIWVDSKQPWLQLPPDAVCIARQ